MCAAINIWCGLRHCTEVGFASFFYLSYAIVENSQERKLAKRTSVQCSGVLSNRDFQRGFSEEYQNRFGAQRGRPFAGINQIKNFRNTIR